MPRDMAVKWPHPRIIRIILQDQISRRISIFTPLHNLHIAAGGGGVICDFAIPFPLAFGEDEEIVPVEMHGVVGADVVADDEADGGVGAEVLDGPLGGVRVGGVSGGGEEEDGAVVVGAEGDVVYMPEIEPCGVGAEGDVEVEGCCGVGESGEGEKGFTDR